jgi:DNA-binding response OmpR family regulator
MRFLIVEESNQVVKDITFCLQVRYPDAFFSAINNGKEAIQMIESEDVDLVMLDSSISDMDHLTFISGIRELSDVPLFVLYERETDFDRAKGLDAGADEYISLPFSPIELLAKINSILRRSQTASQKDQAVISVGDILVINPSNREVLLSGKRVNLTPTEYRLLIELVRSEGRVLTHETLLEKVWGSRYSYDRDASFIKTYIYRLRSKIEYDANNPRMLISERGIGYKFVRPV